MQTTRKLIAPILLLLLSFSGLALQAQSARRIQSVSVDGKPAAWFYYDKFGRLSRFHSSVEDERYEAPIFLKTHISYDRSGQLMSMSRFADMKGSTSFLFERRYYRLDIYNRVIEEKVVVSDTITGRKMIPYMTRRFSYASKYDLLPNAEQTLAPDGSLWQEIIYAYGDAGASSHVEVYGRAGRLLEAMSLSFDAGRPMFHQNIPWILREWICIKCQSPPVELLQTHYKEDGSEEQEVYLYLTDYDGRRYPKRITVINETKGSSVVFDFYYVED